MSAESTAWLPWASVAATLSVVKKKVIEFLTATYADPRFFDDILLEIVSYLDAPDAARAARVCRQWRTPATRVAYTHVILHSETYTSVLLAQTLAASQHLRSYVRHITILHCHPARPNLRNYRTMYGWLERLAPGSLRTFRAVGDYIVIPYLRAEPAVRSCPNVQILAEFIDFPGCIQKSSWKSPRHRHTADIAFLKSPSPEFLSQFVANWTQIWNPLCTLAIDLTIVCATGEPGTRLQHLRDSISPLLDTSRHSTIWLAIGNQQNSIDADIWPSDLMDLLISRAVNACLCFGAPVTMPSAQPGIGPAHAQAAAMLAAGASLPWSTIETMLDHMGHLAKPPRWARMQICYTKQVTEARGCRKCGVLKHGIVQWRPEA